MFILYLCSFLKLIYSLQCAFHFQEELTGEIVLYIKGADTVMASMVEYNDWLEEECTNLAQKGLRTLVVARKVLTPEQYTQFEVSQCFFQDV